MGPLVGCVPFGLGVTPPHKLKNKLGDIKYLFNISYQRYIIFPCMVHVFVKNDVQTPSHLQCKAAFNNISGELIFVTQKIFCAILTHN
jgi:hypothetical protein